MATELDKQQDISDLQIKKSSTSTTPSVSSLSSSSSPSSSSWSYSHFMYKLVTPFEDELVSVERLLLLTDKEIENLLQRILNHCNRLRNEMINGNIVLRPNKIYVHCVDVDYSFPCKYNFIEACRNFIRSAGIIVFNHLDNFEIIVKFLSHFRQILSRSQHPMTGDSLWHLNPFIMDMIQTELVHMYNFRGETPNERRMLAELLKFPQVTKFPMDITNTWDMSSMVFVDKKCTTERDPLGLCKFIKKNIDL